MALQTGNVHTYSQNTWSWSDVIAAPDGAFYLAYKNDSTSIAVEKWDGSAWAEYASFSIADTPTPDTTFSDDLDLAITSDGHLHIVFRHSNHIDGNFNLPRGVSYGEFNGTSWNFSVVDEASDSNGWKNYDDPSLVVDAEGHAHIAYLYSDVNGNGAYDVRYATNEGGSWVITRPASWTGDGVLNRGVNELHDPSLTIAPDGKLTLTYVFEDNQNDVHGNIYAMEKPSGGTWSGATKIYDAISADFSPYYDLGAADAQGHPHLIYAAADGSLHDLTNASGSWQTTEILPSTANASNATDYQVMNGTQYMLVTNTAGDTYFYYNSGAGWQQGNQAITGDSDLDFAVNGDGVGMVITLDNGAEFLRDINYATGDVGAPTNSAPTVTGLPAGIAVTEDLASPLDISSSSFADLDGDAITVALSVSAGTIALAATDISVAFTGNGTSTVTIAGSAADVNAYLDQPTNAIYSPPANLNGTNAATLSVSANDGSGSVDLGTVPINIAAVNDAPIVTAPATITVTEDTAGALTGISFSDVDAGSANVTATFAVPSGTLAATSGSGVTVGGTASALTLTGSLANINTFIAASNLTFTTAQDAIADVTLTITINDGSNTGAGGALSDSTTATISVNAVNDAPTVTTSGGATSFVEASDGPSTGVIIDPMLTVFDPDSPTLASAEVTITGNFQPGEDILVFVNDGATMGDIVGSFNAAIGRLTLTSASAPTLAQWLSALRAVTYDNISDTPNTAVRTVSFSINDGFDDSANATKTITVTSVNDTPTDILLSSTAVAENDPGAVIGLLTTVDPDMGDTHGYSVNDARFEVVGNQLKLVAGAALDYETEPTVTLNIRSTDSGNLFFQKTFTIDVTDMNEAPVITSNGGGATAILNVAENTQAVTTVAANDVDAGDTLTYSISGADAAHFTIAATGELSFISPPDFETPTDADGDNIYDVTVRATDTGGLFDEQALSITVADVYEVPPNSAPRFTGPSELSIEENQFLVAALAASDPDGDALSYTITGGADAAKFKIDATTGVLSFTNAPDFEAPGSTAGSNNYHVNVTVSDGSLSASQMFRVAVTDTDDEISAPGTGTSPDGNNVFQATDAFEHFHGGDGRDTVIFTGSRDDYTIKVQPDGSVTVGYGNGTDTLSSIERLQFDDGTLAFDFEGTAGQAYRLYQAAFDRAPDAEGLGYWIGFLDNGTLDLEAIADLFEASAEFIRRYGDDDSVSNADFVDLLYQHALGRGADSAGFAFWLDKLESDEIDRGDALAFFSESPENSEQLLPYVADGMWYV